MRCQHTMPFGATPVDFDAADDAVGSGVFRHNRPDANPRASGGAAWPALWWVGNNGTAPASDHA